MFALRHLCGSVGVPQPGLGLLQPPGQLLLRLFCFLLPPRSFLPRRRQRRRRGLPLPLERPLCFLLPLRRQLSKCCVVRCCRGCRRWAGLGDCSLLQRLMLSSARADSLGMPFCSG